MGRLSCIRNARVRRRSGLCDILLAQDGRISEVRPARAGWSKPPAPGELDADGKLAVPPFIDIHLHLDLAYSLELVPENQSGTLVDAIKLWSQAKRTLSADNVRERALRAIADEIGYGVGSIRTHVDVATSAGLRLCEGVLAAREQSKQRIDIQIVAFPQDGILRDPGAYEQMREALRLGVDLVGGIAHYERTAEDSRRHIDLVFDLAQEFDRDIDVHIDETDDPYSLCVEYLAAQTIERRWQGRVTASHVCALSSYDEVHAARVIALLAEAQIHVVTNPGVNLHLQGRFDRYPKRRGLTRVSELLAAGVNVSAGQDCIKDPFYPLGTGNMLEVGHLLIHADHLSTPEQIERVADTITANPARVMHRRDYGIDAGCRADLVLLPVESVHEAFRLRVAPALIIRGGDIAPASMPSPP